VDFLLVGSAIVTAVPLLLFTFGAKRLHLSTLGILLYIGPTCSFFLAVFVYDEPFAFAQIFSFIMIWSALFLYSLDSIRYYKKSKG
jgi:chloramphenicol-sensitive protein RarD